MGRSLPPSPGARESAGRENTAYTLPLSGTQVFNFFSCDEWVGYEQKAGNNIYARTAKVNKKI
jgi:hypothetical protein